ncbi:hypothetical protein RB653_000297 [Dictyostelium firmibasis]|uniref:Calcium uniporter protein n=1 Tax=Dictyostelium firmibasis TaxID=79012 RepID=A0AAN7YVT6_9MYCE
MNSFVIRNSFGLVRTINTRFFTTSTQNLEGELKTILKQAKVSKLQERLQLDPRSKITFTEFKGIAKDFGIEENEINPVSNALAQSGSIIYLPNSLNENLKTSVFIKPTHIYQSLEHVLDIENKGIGLNKLIESKKSEINNLRQKIQPLEQQKQLIDRKAQRGATAIIWTGLGYCFVQAAVLARLTWWDLSWDIIEPVSYFLTFGSVLIGYTYFTMTKTEFTYEALNHRLFSKRQDKLFRRNNFPKEDYGNLVETIDKKEKELRELELATKYDHTH